MYLYESQVWQVMITYGGIILSFIKVEAAEQLPEVSECVYIRFFCRRLSTHILYALACV